MRERKARENERMGERKQDRAGERGKVKRRYRERETERGRKYYFCFFICLRYSQN